MSVMQRQRMIWKSYRSLPLWVQVWVGLILVPVNAAAFFMLPLPAAQYTAVAAVVVIVTNGPLLVYYAGMNRSLSIPHLIAWIPLEVALLMRLLEGDPGLVEQVYAVLVLLVNAISLVFDALDSWRWLRGERETPGIETS